MPAPPIGPSAPGPNPPPVSCIEEVPGHPTSEDLDATVEQVKYDPLAGPKVEDL